MPITASLPHRIFADTDDAERDRRRGLTSAPALSRDDRPVWRGERLQASLHHDPTPGGPTQMVYRRQCAETLALHERFFGPPMPGALARDASPFCVTRAIMTDGTTGLSCRARRPDSSSIREMTLTLNPFDWTAGPFLTLYRSLCGHVFLFSLRRHPDDRPIGAWRAPGELLERPSRRRPARAPAMRSGAADLGTTPRRSLPRSAQDHHHRPAAAGDADRAAALICLVSSPA